MDWAKTQYVSYETPGGAPMREQVFDLLVAVPNGAVFGHDRKAQVTRMRLTAEGMKAGAADVFVMFPSNGHPFAVIEMKCQRKHYASPAIAIKAFRSEQQTFAQSVRNRGALTVCAYGWVEAARFLQGYLNLQGKL